MKLSFNLNNKQIKALKNLQSKFEREAMILGNYSDKKKAYIRKNSVISNIGASTRIENALLTDIEIEWIDTEMKKGNNEEMNADKEAYLLDKISKDKERSLEEVAGYRQGINIVFDMYTGFHTLRESDIKGLHREILKYCSKAGCY
jgi:hypothetical protein